MAMPCHGIDMGALDISWTFMNLHRLLWQCHGTCDTDMDFPCTALSFHGTDGHVNAMKGFTALP